MKRSDLYHLVGGILGRMASIGDKFIGHLHAGSVACERAAHVRDSLTVCPYCQEHIRTVEDHVMWCDMADSLKNPLADENTRWPIGRYGLSITKELAEALTKEAM